MARLLWTQKQDIGPGARLGHAMAFDSARGRTVLFGGSAGTSLLNDTWEWDGADWTQIQDVGPLPRLRTALAFDSTRGRTVLFGGQTKDTTFGDTWEWDGVDWTQVQDVGPSARSGHALAFDSDQQRTFLFGGRAGGTLLGDTWEWDGNDWTQVDDVGPPVRDQHGMVYAADRKCTVLFGGAGTTGPLADTWERDTTHWTRLQDVGPSRQGLAMAFKGASVALFGGEHPAQAAVFGDTWDWDGQHWTERQDMGPQARWLHAMTFDSARGRLVVFGGTGSLAGDSQVGDTWEAAGDDGAAVGSGGVVLDSLSVSLDGATFGTYISGVISLSAPAPADGVVVLLSVDKPIANGLVTTSSARNIAGLPPWSIPIAAGSASVSFNTANPVAFGTFTFTASLGGVVKTSSVTVG